MLQNLTRTSISRFGLRNARTALAVHCFRGNVVFYSRNNFSRREKSTSASWIDFPLPDAVRDEVKRTILDNVSKHDSRVWSGSKQEAFGLGIDRDVHALQDPLDDLFLQGDTRYWPGIPQNVNGDADPFVLSKSEVNNLSRTIREDLLGTDHPVLNKAASHFFANADGGKKVRPMMVMLLSRALADTLGPANRHVRSSLFTEPLPWQRPDLPQAQRRLAEISEMMHTASLFHDDVIDGAETRRGVASVHMVFGNKMAILAGDYLLARASICLAGLRNVDVVETMSSVIEHLVRGEVMQMRGCVDTKGTSDRMEYYLKKNYYKTGSLMANSCRSAALLADCPPDLLEASYKFGKHVGMAFQLVDDVLDFEGCESSMGKPAFSDLKAGLATAPILFAAEAYPELEPLIERKFKKEGDIERAKSLVLESLGIQRTKRLARLHAELAMESILYLADSVHRDALINLAYKIVSRTK